MALKREPKTTPSESIEAKGLSSNALCASESHSQDRISSTLIESAHYVVAFSPKANGLNFDRIFYHLGNTNVIRENLPLFVIFAAYILTVYTIHSILGIRDRLVIKCYYELFAYLAIVFSAILLCISLIKGSYKQYFGINYVVGFLTVFLLAPAFASTFASYKQTIPLINNFAWDAFFSRVDYLLHGAHHPWRLLEFILLYPAILRFFDYAYMLWFVFLFLFCLYMAWSKRRRLRLCFFISTLLVWILLGSGLGTIFSSAGPCYFSRVHPSVDNPFEPLMTRLDEIHKLKPLYAIGNQVGLWQAMEEDRWLPFGGISAMPSIHLAMATLFALVTFSFRKWLGWIFAGYAVLIQIGSVILGWHYAVDGYIGILLAVLIWRCCTLALTHKAFSFSKLVRYGSPMKDQPM